MSEILSIIDVNDYGIQSMVAGGGADLQEKTATPTTSQQVIQADEGYDGLSSVTVNAVTSAIDENIIPTNIRTGKTILGVQGNLEPDKPDQNKTVTPSTVEQVIRADTGYELAQVIVEAVPDETPELNAQDTALSNQETVIGQLSSALDDKIALDLADATSDANATANDIAQNKTAYVNGVKLTGTMEEPSPNWSEIGYSETPPDILDDFAYSKSIADNWDSSQTSLYRKYAFNTTLKYFPLVDTSNVTNTAEMFITCTNLVTFPLLNMNEVTRMDSMFSDCTSLRSFPQVNIPNVTNIRLCFNNCTSLTNISPLSIPKVENMYFMFNGCSSLTNIELSNMDNVEDMGWAFRQCTNIISVSLNNTLKINNLTGTFAWCTSLTTIPQLSTGFVTNMSSMVSDCPNLSNESLNNILAMCTNSAVTSNKTLSNIGLSQTQAETCQTLSNWDAFVAAGWSTGY